MVGSCEGNGVELEVPRHKGICDLSIHSKEAKEETRNAFN